MMTTLHLGIEEMIARRQHESMEHATRHTWRLTEFWRTRDREPQPTAHRSAHTWRGELVEWGVTYTRLAML